MLRYLACPETGEPLTLAELREERDGHVIEGALVSERSGRRYPIRHGVPLLLPDTVDDVEQQTAARFDTQWKHWRSTHDYYRRQLLDWIAPVDERAFAGRTVFEGGCGKGRHSALVGAFGPEDVVSLDLGESVFVAFENTRHLPNVHVVMGDLLRPPVEPVFDVAFSIGVLHHLPDPAAGFASLARTVREGGRVVSWVYGLENNEWIPRYVDPLRMHVTSKLPARLLRALSALPAGVLWCLIRALYAGGRAERLHLPYAEYFAGLRAFPFAEIHNIVFDQLVTPVAYYLPEAEVQRWYASGFRDVEIAWKGRYSWTGTGIVARTG